jgi:hypothetical protein
MDKAKVRLSPNEAELVVNAGWILTKNNILQKAKYMLEQLQSEQQQFLQAHSNILPAEVMKTTPKISKGENYKGLPYLVLDQPRYFEKDNYFAIRSMFWWGNFFSLTLHLSGIYKTIYENKIETSLSLLRKEGHFICISADQWEHHFESGNYLPLQEMSEAEFKSHISHKKFIKLAKKLPLELWDDAGDILFEAFCKTIGWLGDQLPSR